MANPISTAPKPGKGKPGSGTPAASGGGGESGSGGSGGGGGGMSSYERRQNAKENEAKRKAARKYKDQAATLQQQADALKLNINGGFEKSLRARLANLSLVYKQQDASLLSGYRDRVGDLKGAARDNERAANDTGFTNLSNRGRERAAALTEAGLQGAGESDQLRSQVMSLRSWDNNQGENNRAYFDGLRSINSSLGDLNVDTRTARINAAAQRNNDADQLYTQYYNQKSEAYTNLGNLYGQQAELYGLAEEQVGGAGKKSQKKKSKASGDAFDRAARAAVKTRVNPGVSKNLTEWKGTSDFEGAANNSLFENAATNLAPAKRPEGAKLREW